MDKALACFLSDRDLIPFKQHNPNGFFSPLGYTFEDRKEHYKN